MLFNSLTYLLFLIVVVAIYWQLPPRPRLWLVFAASCVFYGFWRLEFLPLLLFSAVMDYGLARWIDGTQNNRRRKRLLIVSIVANLSILFFFKYLIFFRDATYSVAALAGYHPGFVELKIILPLGISFYIFATISYVIDVYRREFPAERDLLLYACFVVYFPHLVAGPILRARSLIPQLRDRPRFELSMVTTGIARIVAGLFLKVVLADPIGQTVNDGFARAASSLTGTDSWTLAFLFGFQIYFDFAAYSSIAIGSALVMGIALPENFDWPYLAATPRSFWRRWHISLSTWIRDYVYLPMAGAYRRQGNDAIGANASAPQAGLPREQRTLPLFATWALMGLWHGANWTFVVWGVYHAAMVWLHRQFSAAGRALRAAGAAGGRLGDHAAADDGGLGRVPLADADADADHLALDDRPDAPARHDPAARRLYDDRLHLRADAGGGGGAVRPAAPAAARRRRLSRAGAGLLHGRLRGHPAVPARHDAVHLLPVLIRRLTWRRATHNAPHLPRTRTRV